MKKKRLLFLRALGPALLAVIAVLAVMFVILPDRAYSPNENRNLQQFPALNLRTLASGRFESRFESYVADQFPLRDLWVRAQSFVSRLLGSTKSGGVFLGKDGYLIQNFTEPAEADYAATLSAIKAFSARHGGLRQYFLLAPSALTIYRDRLPAFAVAGDEAGYIERLRSDLSDTSIQWVDALAALSNAGVEEQLYYRTDHHWTTDGARIAYQKLCEAVGLPDRSGEYERLQVTDAFSGTLTATSGFRMSETDGIYIYLPNEDRDYVVTYVEENRRSASAYVPENLSLRDKYTVFFGGNYAEVKIDTVSTEKRCLLVIKDSYANCFVPFLFEDFGEIIMVDPRYFTGDMDVLMEAEGVTDVLFLYNANTLATDSALREDIG